MGKKYYTPPPLDPNAETVMWNWKGYGRGKDADLETDWHPVSLSTRVMTVGFFRIWESCRRQVVPPWARILAWKCPSFTMTPQGIAGLLVQGVPLTAWGSIQWILSAGVRHTSESQHVCRAHAEATCFSKAWGSLPENLWLQGVGGGHGWWNHHSLHRKHSCSF